MILEKKMECDEQEMSVLIGTDEYSPAQQYIFE
jgi:hypothetical protein